MSESDDDIDRGDLMDALKNLLGGRAFLLFVEDGPQPFAIGNCCRACMLEIVLEWAMEHKDVKHAEKRHKGVVH